MERRGCVTSSAVFNAPEGKKREQGRRDGGEGGVWEVGGGSVLPHRVSVADVRPPSPPPSPGACGAHGTIVDFHTMR